MALLLVRLRGGDKAASSDLLAILYSELRDLAGRLLRPQRDGHTLQPTALARRRKCGKCGKTSVNGEGGIRTPVTDLNP